jgi:hypothetical protein
VTGAEVTLSLTSRISPSLPTSRRGRSTARLEFGASARACSDMLTLHYRARDDALATTSAVRAARIHALAAGIGFLRCVPLGRASHDSIARDALPREPLMFGMTPRCEN